MQIGTHPENSLRIDKWLWCARFFKTRSLATEAVDKGHVQLNGQACKPAKDVHPGDRLVIVAHQQRWEIEVLGIPAARGSAPVAQTLYQESEASRAARAAETERRKLYREPAEQLQGRPTKRDRRRITQLRD